MFIRHISNHEKVKKVTEGDSEETWKKPRDYKETRFLRTKNCECNMTIWTSKSRTSFDKNKSQV